MARFFFHYCLKDQLLLDHIVVELQDLRSAHEHAGHLIRRMTSVFCKTQDWRGWEIVITDEAGQVVLTVLFPRHAVSHRARRESQPA